MGRRRGEVQILMDILNISLKGVKATHLMYKANLSYSTLRRYLLAVVKQGLVIKLQSNDGTTVYHTSEKGKLLLERLKEVQYALHS